MFRQFQEFHSEPEGAFLSTGFDLRVGHRPGNIRKNKKDDKNDGDKTGGDSGGDKKCEFTFTSSDLESAGDREGIFLSPEHWYPPGTNCTFRLLGRPWEVVRLHFPSFRVGRIEDPLRPEARGECRESLAIYDAEWVDGERVIRSDSVIFQRLHTFSLAVVTFVLLLLLL